MLKEFHGYYALGLVTSDGIPEYSHGSLYDGIDETSFRGAFLKDCDAVLSQGLRERAWEHKLPEAAVDYGPGLLAAAAAAAAGPLPSKPPPKRGLFSFLAPARKAAEPTPWEEQIKIVEAAGRWLVFWGDRGHAIRAWF